MLVFVIATHSIFTMLILRNRRGGTLWQLKITTPLFSCQTSSGSVSLNSSRESLAYIIPDSIHTRYHKAQTQKNMVQKHTLTTILISYAEMPLISVDIEKYISIICISITIFQYSHYVLQHTIGANVFLFFHKRIRLVSIR